MSVIQYLYHFKNDKQMRIPEFKFQIPNKTRFVESVITVTMRTRF